MHSAPPERALISQLLNNHQEENAGIHQNRYPCPRTKEKYTGISNPNHEITKTIPQKEIDIHCFLMLSRVTVSSTDFWGDGQNLITIYKTSSMGHFYNTPQIKTGQDYLYEDLNALSANLLE